MYQGHFGLHDDPFALGPSLKYLYRSRAHAETMAHLGYGLEQGEDIVLISGAIGTGKTLALQNLQAKVSGMFHQVLINVTTVSYVEFLKLVLAELDADWPAGADIADLLVALKKQALAVHAAGRKILLIVDEAQNLKPDTLEGIRLLTNMGQPDKQLFQIVLVGQPALEAIVDLPELAQLRQRIRIHYRLEPLSLEETGDYLAHRVGVAGRREPLFSRGAVGRIHELSRGVPRLVNHLASHALLAAYVDKDTRVEARHVAAEGLPEAPAAVDSVDHLPPARAGAAVPSDAVARDGGELGAPPPPRRPEIHPTPAPRPRTTGHRREEPAPRRRSLVWVWIWLLVIAVVALGAWQLLDEPRGRSRGEDLVPGRSGTDMPPQTSVAVPTGSSPGTDAGPPPPGASGSDAGVAGREAAARPEAIEPPSSTDGGDGPPEVEREAGMVTDPDRTAVIGGVGAPHWVHVASFRDREIAQRYHEFLRRAGVPADARDVVLDDGQRWHRVLVGPYATPAVADSAASSLEARGVITFHRVLIP